MRLAVAHVDGVRYITLESGGVARVEDGVGNKLWHTFLYPEAHEDIDPNEAPHLGIAVALDLCFVSDCVRAEVVALDANNLRERFSFGRSELDNPVAVAWQEGLLWVADANPDEGQLVAYSFEHHGPRMVHTILGVNVPVGVVAAHGRLYIACRDDGSVHVIRTAGYTAQGARSLLNSVPHESHV